MKYRVIFYYHTNCEVEVEADNENDAIQQAYCEVSDERYTQQILDGLQENSCPDVEEIDDIKCNKLLQKETSIGMFADLCTQGSTKTYPLLPGNG